MQEQTTTLILNEQSVDKLICRLIQKTRKQKSGCIDWMGGTTQDGYGQIALPGMKGMLICVHRASYELFVGPIADGLKVMHKCDNTRCVNPAHLLSGTQSDNMKDMIAKKRRNHYRTEYRGNKISEETAEMIRELCHSGRTHLSVAKQVGLSRAQVTKIASGMAWKLKS